VPRAKLSALEPFRVQRDFLYNVPIRNAALLDSSAGADLKKLIPHIRDATDEDRCRPQRHGLGRHLWQLHVKRPSSRPSMATGLPADTGL
jgi:hypothetical protein